MPKVSVIAPTFNRVNLLPRALQSVLNQGFRDIELIVVDDGSTDGTKEVVAALGDSRIRYIRFPRNHGIGAARNAGVNAVRGELVGFVDSDDAWLPGKLECQIQLFDRYSHIGLIFGDYNNINLITGTTQSGFVQSKQSLDSVRKMQREPDFWEITSGVAEALLHQNFFATPTVMLQASVFDLFGNFHTGLSGPEDFEFWWRCAVRGVKMAYITRLLIDRNKDNESITAAAIRFAPRYLKALDLCEQTARGVGQLNLIRNLDAARGRVWSNLVHTNAVTGSRVGATKAFLKTIRYGVSPHAAGYYLAALAGPGAIGLGKKVRGIFVDR